MPLLNSLDQVWQNVIAVSVIGFVFYWIYKNMEDNKFKESIKNFYETLKGE